MIKFPIEYSVKNIDRTVRILRNYKKKIIRGIDGWLGGNPFKIATVNINDKLPILYTSA